MASLVASQSSSLNTLDEQLAAVRRGEQIDIDEFLKRRATGQFKLWQQPTGHEWLSAAYGWMRPLPHVEVLGVLWENDKGNGDELPSGLFGAMEMRPDTCDGFTRALWTIPERDWKRMRQDAYFGTYDMALNACGTRRFAIHRWQQPGTPRPDFSKGGVQ